MDALVVGLFKTGAPWGILCAVLLAIVAVLWKHIVTLSAKLYDLGIKQIESTSAFREEMRKAHRESTSVIREEMRQLQREMEEMRRLH